MNINNKKSMTVKRILTSIVLGGALVLGTVGCIKDNDHSQYLYDGKIGKDYVKFSERFSEGKDDMNILTVTKQNGKIITYMDQYRDNLIIEKVKITQDGKTKKYTMENEVGKPIMIKAQKQFNDYCHKLKKLRLNKD